MISLLLKKKNFYVTYYKSRKLNLSTAIYLYASQRNDIIKSKTKTFFSNVFENTKTNNINNLLVNVYFSMYKNLLYTNIIYTSRPDPDSPGVDVVMSVDVIRV